MLTDADGHASGVEYVDANGVAHVQRARTVILASYTFENVRLMLLSGDARHPDGLGNGCGQLGRYYMTKMFAHVDGHFPDVVFNRHTGPAAQGMVLDDFLSADFDGPSHGFLGGGTLGTENQFLPLQISRESLPPGCASAGGDRYREHLKRWQHLGVVRVQPDALPYHSSRLDLDPRHRDRSGLGLPVVRITYDLQPDEHRRAAWLEGKAAEILRSMGADTDLVRAALHRRGQQPRHGRLPDGRVAGHLGGRSRAAGPRHARPVRARRCRLPQLPRHQSHSDALGAGAAGHRAAGGASA